MSQILIPYINELRRFVVKAKKNAWAGDRGEVAPERAGFKEHKFSEGEWHYRDSYVGFYCAPGQEIVRFREVPVWAMSYDGDMLKEHWGNLDLARQTFAFLKQALMEVDESLPFRGPPIFERKEGKWIYLNNECYGNIERFTGCENIKHNNQLVFTQNYIGGLVISK